MSYADPPAATFEKLSRLCVGRFFKRSERLPEDALVDEDVADDVMIGWGEFDDGDDEGISS